MNRVTVKAYGHLRQFMPDARETVEVEIEDGATFEILLERVGIPREEVWLVSVDDEVVDEAEVVPRGAHVLVMAPVEGG